MTPNEKNQMEDLLHRLFPEADNEELKKRIMQRQGSPKDMMHFKAKAEDAMDMQANRYCSAMQILFGVSPSEIYTRSESKRDPRSGTQHSFSFTFSIE